ncbi:RING-H2 finger protein atl16 [Phtheirospermum japonicum]|uniref:RING-type E3 ubiquitin transferase n=1 Tax=Phtheirospermum japonicum TaxID=374723 RepID=A0A830B750_9LAMI|nr:RING-H2 finger protein atl16 [Phtheirospermum japonicum]
MATLQSQSLPPIINGHDLFSNQPPPPVSGNGFPMLAVAVLGIAATAFLLVSYYIFVSNCCFRWQIVDPLGRFSFRRAQPNEDPLTSYSPSWQSRGLNELLIRDIPTFQYGREFTGSSKCVVCLNEFQDQETLRVLPKCSHAFHLDCIDVWLLSNSNCPLCRSAISGRNRYRPRPESTVAPNSSPQDPHPMAGGVSDEFVEIVISRGDDEQRERGDSRRFQKVWKSSNKPRKLRRVSVMGDEGIHVREKDDDRFCVQPIRRSFSMDSAVDRHVYLSVQEIIQQNRGIDEARNINNEESGSRSRRSIFSFGHGRGSRNAVLPVE